MPLHIPSIPACPQITAFVEAYWNSSPLARDIQECIASISFGSLEEKRKSLEYRHKRYDEFLTNKYGPDIMQRWFELAQKNVAECQLNDSIGVYPHGAYHDIHTFCYTTGLIHDAPIQTLLRSKATLESLLILLHPQKHPFTLTDLGCGDSRILIGCALYLDKLEKVRAIDVNPAALARAEHNIQALPSKQQATVRAKIEFVQGDYCDSEFKKKNEKKTSICLSAYPVDHLAAIIEAASDFTIPEGRILTYYPLGEGDAADLVAEHNQYGASHGLNFHAVDVRQYWMDDSIVATQGFNMKSNL